MKSITFILIFFVFALSAYGQKSVITGRITYISSGVVYTSLGRDAGVIDSSLIIAFSGNDTIAVLKVFATSSKTSVCTILDKKRDLKVGDALIFIPLISETKSSSIDYPIETVIDSKPIIVVTDSVGKDSIQSSSYSWLLIHGSVGLQY
jgi:hypothetical protein